MSGTQGTVAGIVWRLTGKPYGGGACDHCDRALVHRYEVTSSAGDTMIVGRGCLKAVTGWTLSAAQAAREVRMIAVRARRTANWAAFTESHPHEAAVILADCKAFAARYDMSQFGGGAPHEVKHYVEDEPDRMDLVAGYMARRGEWAWAATTSDIEE